MSESSAVSGGFRMTLHRLGLSVRAESVEGAQLLGAIQIDLDTAAIIGIHIRPPSMFVAGRFSLATIQGTITIRFPKKKYDEFALLYRKLLATGVQSDVNVLALEPMNFRPDQGQELQRAARTNMAGIRHIQARDLERKQYRQSQADEASFRAQLSVVPSPEGAVGARQKSRKFRDNIQKTTVSSGQFERHLKPAPMPETTIIGQDTYLGVIEVMKNRGSHPQVFPRDSSYTKLEVEGFDHFQSNLACVVEGNSGGVTRWLYGFLAPELENSRAETIAVFVIHRKHGMPITAVQGGYLTQESAARLFQPLSTHLINTGKVVPILIRLNGGQHSQIHYGFAAHAYCAELGADPSNDAIR